MKNTNRNPKRQSQLAGVAHKALTGLAKQALRHRSKSERMEFVKTLDSVKRELDEIAIRTEASIIRDMLPPNLARITWVIEDEFNDDYQENVKAIEAHFTASDRTTEVTLAVTNLCDLENSLSDLTGPELAVIANVVCIAAGVDPKTVVGAKLKIGQNDGLDFDQIKRFAHRCYRYNNEDSHNF